MRTGLIAVALVVGSTGFASAQGGSPGAGGGAVGGTTGSPSGTGAGGQPGLKPAGNQGAGHSSL